MKKVTVADLSDQTGVSGPHPLLVCLECGAEYSANKADYFMSPLSHVFKCCGVPMQLATKKTVYDIIE
jgi:hypothetical protein